jgi:predicted PurR-regulated permease PerM
MSKGKAFLNSAIVLYFIICFEILIMISPFAGFFYSAFNPFLLGFAKYRATKWLSSFFFTHMVVPPNDLLKTMRVMGSVLFVLGLIVFLVCAVQVYASKFFKKGRPVLKGLYFDQTACVEGAVFRSDTPSRSVSPSLVRDSQSCGLDFLSSSSGF